MNDSEDSAEAKQQSGIGSPDEAVMVNIYAKTAKRRGPGRPRTRTDVLRQQTLVNVLPTNIPDLDD